MSESLRVSLVQVAATLDPAESLAGLGQVADLAPVSDLVIFPEAYARDFGTPGSDLSPYAESLDGPFVSRMVELSQAHGVAILAGMFEVGPEGGLPYNTLVLVDGDRLHSYRKVHLYDSFGFKESNVLSAGDPDPVVVDVRGFPVGLMVCYDLRFPEFARALVAAGAEAIAIPAAWVAGPRKQKHWSTLLRARAIEDVSYVLGVGQSGPRYTGFSSAYSPLGDELALAGTEDAVLNLTIDRAVVREAREANPSLNNRRL